MTGMAGQLVSESIADSSIGGALGGVAGPVLGALGGAAVSFGLSMLLNGLFKKNSRGPDESQKPWDVRVTNWPEFFKQWVLPHSAYYQPSGLYNQRSIIQHNNNTINVSSGPKVAERVQRAITDQAFQDQLSRGLI